MEHSQTLCYLAEGLAKFQATVVDPQKTSTAKVVTKNGAGYSFKYAGLDAIVKAVRAGLAEQGIAFTQFPINCDNGQVGIQTMLIHSSGEWIKSDPFYVPVGKMDAQGFGSCLTYAKRYSLAAVLGISADEDDDANYGCGNQAEIQTKASKQAIAPGAQNAAWVDDIRHKLADKCKEQGIDAKFLCKVMQVAFKKEKGFTVGEYTEMLQKFEELISKHQEAAMALFEDKAS